MADISTITVNNDAGFDLSFYVQWQDGGGHWQQCNWNSGSYPIDQNRTSPDLGTLGVPDRATVRVYIDPAGGSNKASDDTVTYVSGSTGNATYTVKGVTIDYHIDLNG